MIIGIQIDRISAGGDAVTSSFGVESQALLLVEPCAMYEWAELRHFRYLLTILERQGFRAAAEELHTAQPNLSVQARQFQENASVRLFRKMKDGRIRPTDTGVAFKVLARFLLETRDEVLDALISIERGEVNSVRFGCTPLVDQGLFRTFCDLHKEILPLCPVRPTHGDTAHLAEEVVSGKVDAALVTLPLRHADLRIEELRRDRLVVCLRRDDPFCAKASLPTADLQGNLAVLYHPQRHPDAHERLLELLRDAGVQIDEYSWASHPSDMQTLVKGGHGFALIREGTNLDEELTTRPIAGVDWTVDTALIYHKVRHPKTVPILAKRLRKHLPQHGKETARNKVSISVQASIATGKRPVQRVTEDPVQMKRRS